jgi:hypothetical protein
MNAQHIREPRDEQQCLVEENARLQERVAELTREVQTMRPVVAAAKKMRTWDHNPYDVRPDDAWIALDRESAAVLMQALAGVDHWEPWSHTIAPRPQP